VHGDMPRGARQDQAVAGLGRARRGKDMTSSDIFVASIFLALCAMAWLAIFGRGS
jgi:hypothetical protein